MHIWDGQGGLQVCLSLHSLKWIDTFPLDNCTPKEYSKPMIVIRRLVWDTWNIVHIARHDVVPDEVEEVCHGII